MDGCGRGNEGRLGSGVDWMRERVRIGWRSGEKWVEVGRQNGSEKGSGLSREWGGVWCEVGEVS